MTRFYCDECEGDGRHELWCALNREPMPEGPSAEELARRQAAIDTRREAFEAEFEKLIAGRVKIARVNHLAYNLRQKYALFEDRKTAVTVLRSDHGEGLWSHGATVIARQQTDRVTASFGDTYDFYVLPSDPAAEVGREN